MEILSSIFDEYDYQYDNNLSPSDDSVYAEELQLQEALAASLHISSSSSSSRNHHATSSSRNNHATSSSRNHHATSSSRNNHATSSSRNNHATSSSRNHHHAMSSSSSSTRIISCEICTEDKRKSDMHKIEGCDHSFCHDCISKHIQYKLQQNIANIPCPYQGCPNMIQPNNNNGSSLIRSKIPQEVFDRWEKAITESTILASSEEIIHCPYEKCSEILVIENGGNVITETECPRCHKLFCAKCRVSWHHGFDCRDFQRLDRNDKEKRKLRLLAKENKWKKCPNCRVFVDKTEGCVHITCRCKFEFCYICGKSWNESHWNTCKE
ncbi:hypothetical protein ABFS82_04G114400 [Erythranthe guttata]|uniref:probable E3 ubiquitin-protein ligase RNF217 n=1 Tax=Erythranthe guttata TaxID=4155 RepID=UPI00064DAD9A|nr:PREDICTED: probable E3 ubiquitin-protein ligase RNF217 [Erythranthe guttata]|eukprot:XP_012852607.1 PREDICTED: probable E3 ubiquitin-protein ligase RNF217 [Erythranthe guttata]